MRTPKISSSNMAIDPQRLDAFLKDPNVPDEAKQRVLAKVGENPAPQDSGERPGFLEAVGQTIKGRAEELGRPFGAPQMGQILRGEVPERPTVLGQLAELPGQAMQVANVAGTIAAPKTTALGVPLEVMDRMAGGSGTAGRMLGEGAGLAYSAGRWIGAGSKRGLKKGADVLLRRNIPTATIEEGGQAARGALKATTVARKAPLKPVFQSTLDFARTNDVSLNPQNPAYTKAVEVAKQARQLLPDLSGPPKKVVQRILMAARPRKGMVDPAGNPIPQSISYDDLETLYNHFTGMERGGVSGLVGQGVNKKVIRRLAYTVRNAQEAALEGFPDVQDAFRTTRRLWKQEVLPVERMSTAVEKLGRASPTGVPSGAEVMGKLKAFSPEDSHRVGQVLAEVGPDSSKGKMVVASMWNKFLTGKDPTDIGKSWDDLQKINPDMARILSRGNPMIGPTLKKIAKIAPLVESGKTGIFRRQAGAVATAGITSAIYIHHTGLSGADVAIPLAAIAAYGGAKGLQLAVRALRTPLGTKEAAKSAVLFSRMVDHIYQEMAPAVQAMEEE